MGRRNRPRAGQRAKAARPATSTLHVTSTQPTEEHHVTTAMQPEVPEARDADAAQSAFPAGSRPAFAPGSQVRIRDEQWLVKSVAESRDGLDGRGQRGVLLRPRHGRGVLRRARPDRGPRPAEDPARARTTPPTTGGPPLPGGGPPQDRPAADRARAGAGRLVPPGPARLPAAPRRAGPVLANRARGC